MGARNKQLHVVILDIFEQGQQTIQEIGALLLIAHILRLHKVPFFVANVGGAWSSGVLRLDALPSLLEQVLYLLQPI